MTNALGRGAAVVAALAVALTLALTGTAFAGGEGHGGGDCKIGTAAGNGATALNSFQFTVCQRSADTHDASGFFSAMATPPANALVRPRGPVTCADIKGKEATFFYPFDAQSSPPPTPAAYGILLYVIDGGPHGQGDKIGFTILPQVASTDCSQGSAAGLLAKGAALQLQSGDIRVTEGKVEMCDPKKDAPK